MLMTTNNKSNSHHSNSQLETAYRSHSLAPVQRRTLEYLRGFIAEHGFGPTLKDISQAIGVKSPSTAHFHLTRLEDKGFIRRGEDGSILLVERDEITVEQSPWSVPLAGVIAAGSPIEAIEDRNVTVDVPPQFITTRGEVYCLQVAGDSMIDAHIMDGDIVVIRKQQNANDGDIVVAVLDDGCATLKTFRRLKGGKISLLPHNPTMSPIIVDNVEIRGKMIGLLREM